MRQFKPQKMVGWYEVKQLASTAIRAILSSIFGSYADKREALAALTEGRSYDYTGESELWLDYISDTGDGFDSTFSMAKLIAEKEISVDHQGGSAFLKRGKLVVFGGDQVYPTPSKEEYFNRFIGPVEAASLQASPDIKSDLFAIPGNHDWYDGLSNFVKIFCQEKSIGGFQTVQNRSYFAIKVTDNTWIWATDVQLQSDIDDEQINYFEWVAKEEMVKGDNVILFTAEPAWVYNSLRKEDLSYHHLEEFERDVIQANGMKQVLTVAGDLHHYARYSREEGDGNIRHKITAGGGGAFLHPTHNLPETLTNMHDGDFELEESFPKREKSKKLTWLNLLFPIRNPGFGLFLSTIHLIMAYALYTTSHLDEIPGTIFTEMGTTTQLINKEIFIRLLKTFGHSPTAMVILLTFIFGFLAFCDGKSSKYKIANFAGVFHGFMHVLLMISLFSFFAWFNDSVIHIQNNAIRMLSMSLEVFFVGGFMSGVLVGFYLLISSLVFKMHDNEAFSSLKIDGYKNFLRFHFQGKKLTIYPIGVQRMPKWKKIKGVFKSNEALKPQLIDKPIEIDLS